MSTSDISQLIDKVKEVLTKAEKKPFVVSIMGQTGVGKSTLLNTLFNVDLPSDPIYPTTREANPISFEGRAGHKLIFYDLPGIGESDETDERYLTEYKQKLKESDIVIWAMHADSRLFAYDLEALRKLHASTGELSMSSMVDKLIFVLTKADLLIPPPWLLAKIEDNSAIFLPQEKTEALLKEKEQYIQENFILRYKDLLKAHTYHRGKFNVNDPHFRYENGIVYYNGYLNTKELEDLKKLYPQYSDVFERLYDFYRVVSCSARFRFNLDLLMRVVVSKIGLEAIARFSSLYTERKRYILPYSEAKRYSNIVVVNEATGKVIFDLVDADI